LSHLHRQADDLYANTDLSLVLWHGAGGIGDIALVPGPWMKHPKGIRDIGLWYMAPLLYPDYVKGIFELQTQIAMKNMELIYQAVGDKIDVFGVSGTDFGTQSGPFIGVDTYREFFKPHHTRMNDWIHRNTKWKIMFHACGSINAFLDDFVDAGVDVINPVQCSATGMDPQTLKDRWGSELVFWGGAIDTQHTLPFGSPDEVRVQAAERISILGEGGGMVAAAIHNIQHSVPVENVLAFFETARQ
jgi:uroporphyrinogen-III decarboxylase